PDHHPHEPQSRARGSGGEPVHSHAHDPRQDDRREGSRRPLHPRSHEHHRGAGGARHRASRGSRARPCARSCRPRGALRRLPELSGNRGPSHTREHPAIQRSLLEETPMAEAATKVKPEVTAAETEQELTDGFHLIIDALKLNGIKHIYGVPGIPITDFGRMAQAAGMRVVSFRHEQNAGNAAAIAGFLTKTPGICLTVSAPGFLNGLTALANATTNCFPMILIS